MYLARLKHGETRLFVIAYETTTACSISRPFVLYMYYGDCDCEVGPAAKHKYSIQSVSSISKYRFTLCRRLLSILCSYFALITLTSHLPSCLILLYIDSLIADHARNLLAHLRSENLDRPSKRSFARSVMVFVALLTHLWSALSCLSPRGLIYILAAKRCARVCRQPSIGVSCTSQC